MNKHKTKFFKKTFEQNADDIYPEHHCGSPTQMMTEETFVPLIGQLWDKAKERYKKRYKQKALEFTEWCNLNMPDNEINMYSIKGKIVYDLENGTLYDKKWQVYLSIEQLFEWWKENIKTENNGRKETIKTKD